MCSAAGCRGQSVLQHCSMKRVTADNPRIGQTAPNRNTGRQDKTKTKEKHTQGKKPQGQKPRKPKDEKQEHSPPSPQKRKGKKGRGGEREGAIGLRLHHTSKHLAPDTDLGFAAKAEDRKQPLLPPPHGDG